MKFAAIDLSNIGFPPFWYFGKTVSDPLVISTAICCYLHFRMAHFNVDYSVTLGLACTLAIKYVFFDTDSDTQNSSPTESTRDLTPGTNCSGGDGAQSDVHTGSNGIGKCEC